MASETSSEAIFPVKLALLKLNLLYYQELYKHVSAYILYICTMLINITMQIIDLRAIFSGGLGPNWDMYAISVLVGVIVLVFVWRVNN